VIKRERGFDVDIVPGGRGQFDVLADGKLIFSKHEEDRFPTEAEILGELAALT
jgi:selT/selW/selH-like putative selenoprotein